MASGCIRVLKSILGCDNIFGQIIFRTLKKRAIFRETNPGNAKTSHGKIKSNAKQTVGLISPILGFGLILIDYSVDLLDEWFLYHLIPHFNRKLAARAILSCRKTTLGGEFLILSAIR